MTQGSRFLNPSRWFRNASPRLFRRLIRLFPAIRHTGVRVDHISDDWRTWRLRLPMNLKTRNYVGTHFGGTLYSAADPHYMLAWMHILGPDYVVWDKAASVRFRKPGRGTLRAEIHIPASDIAEVIAACEVGKHERTYTIAWKDEDGDVVASVEKLLYFRKADG